MKNRSDILGISFFLLGMFLVATGYAPIIRRVAGLEDGLSFMNVVLLLVAGLMAGLSGMMLLARSAATQQTVANSTFPDERRYAAVCHLGSLLIWFGVPLGNFILPFLSWKRVRYRSSFVNRHGMASVNFQISVTFYFLVAVLLFYLIAGVFLLGLLLIFHLLLTFYASWRAWTGQEFEYPMSIRLIRQTETG